MSPCFMVVRVWVCMIKLASGGCVHPLLTSILDVGV